MTDRYRAKCDHHNWRGVKRGVRWMAEHDAQDHEDEYPRPGCMFVEVVDL